MASDSRRAPVLAGALIAVLAACGAPGSGAGSPAAGPAGRAAASLPGPSGPPLRLVESVPVESGLGNPDLPRARDLWPQLIGGARRTLDLEQFYLSTWPGQALDPVLAAIGEAAHRGVRVRLLLDRRMHDTYPRPADSLGRMPGIEVRTVDFSRLAGGVQHAKYFLVDSATVFLGSQNFDWRALEHIHELGVVARDGRLARVFAAVFEADWALGLDVRAGEAPRAAAAPESAGAAARAAAAGLGGGSAVPGLPFTIVQAPGDTARVWPSYSPLGWLPDSTLWDRDAVVRLIDGARTELVGQSLTYSTTDRRRSDDAIDRALRRAAGRGVRVRLVISDWEAEGDAMRSLQSLAGVEGIAIRLSSVAPWSGGYVPFARVEHCKYLVADGERAWIGTGNLEPGYFFGSRNVALTIENSKLALAARTSFEASWAAAAASPVTPTSKFAPRIHGEQPPPGQIRHGD
jgi:phosphatidylserine/phosphatidylglycerophosphate/cardiolipin synthase-like enzyme